MKLVNEAEFRDTIGKLDLDEHRKDQLSKRWLHYVLWWDDRARDSKWKYHALRSIVIVGGAVLPALVSLNISDPKRATYVHTLTAAISVLVAASAGLEGLFGYGEIWREKRAAAEVLKCRGARFFQLIPPYAAAKTHEAAYPEFADEVETMIEHEIKDYLTATQSKKTGKEDEPRP
jgi:uncharacterized protein DUF4231